MFLRIRPLTVGNTRKRNRTAGSQATPWRVLTLTTATTASAQCPEKDMSLTALTTSWEDTAGPNERNPRLTPRGALCERHCVHPKRCCQKRRHGPGFGLEEEGQGTVLDGASRPVRDSMGSADNICRSQSGAGWL